ncbi:MAG: RHS repeat-associated core domain-containing protein, partial [Kiritimatiellia bacterium]
MHACQINAYDGATSRLVRSETTGSPPVTYIYDDLKNRVATVRNDTAAWSETSYATIGNEIWKIETQSRVTDGVTNGVTVMRSQLTGLSNALRSRTVFIDPNGSITTEESVFDASTQQLTTRVWTDDATPNVTVSKFGHAICEINADERTESCFDPHGRAFFRTTCHPVSNAHLYDYWADFDASGNIVHHELYDGSVFITGQSTYDAWNRETSRTDAEGETVHAAYDIAGRPVAVDGATYPIRTRYDTAGRKTGSLATRDDKATWDETQWNYDPRTGLVTNKVYANSTTVGHSYLANGLPERTTWARGAWKELRYDDRNQVSSNLYASVATPSVHRTYAKSGRIASATDAAGTDYRYAYNDNLTLTNETVVIEGRVFEIDRAVDDRQREVRTSVASSNAIHAATTRIFDSEGRLAGLALTNAQKRGVSVVYGYDGSYLTNSTTTLPNGSTFRHALSRNASRRALVNRHDYAFNGSPLLWHACEHDLLGRVSSTMDSTSVARDYLYNARSEVVAASIGTNEYGYAFDTIGNRRTATENDAATIYSANSLNQYTQVDQTALSYDADGNLLGDGAMQYAYDDENRLVSAAPANPTNAVRVVNRYDYRHRRVQKRVERFSGGVWQVQRTHTFVHDGWNPVVERIDAADGTSRTIEYFWGNDLSGTPQGAGGIGGLLAVSVDGLFYVPCYDHNGNVIAYIDEAGTPVARYAYDPFGNTIEQTGALADTFALRFSTKHFDAETGLYYYGRRFYKPGLGRWLNRDPIEEDGGANLYAFCGNDGV